jgi:hypothetical protein
VKTRSQQAQYPLRLSPDTYDMLRAEAEAKGVSINALVAELIETHLRDNRAELIDAIGRAANERYANVLDKLAEL